MVDKDQTVTIVHVIAHTHWDREWYLTREQYRARLVDLIDRVVDRMASEPEFTHFHLDGQTIVLEDFLEVRPEREAELRALVRSGRLLVGPWYVMPDMFLVSGESLVRNLALGLRIAEDFGRAMRVGYMPDPFGHLAQMPQVLAGFGLEGAILWRGFSGRGSEYTWEALDGTRALLLHLPPEGYCNGLGLPLLPPDRMRDAARHVVAREAARSTCGQVLLMVGVDHVEPPPTLLRLVEAVGRDGEFGAALSTLPAYVESVRAASRESALEVVRGELRGGQDYAYLLPGVFSARTYLKQANARTQRELENWAEPLAAFAYLCGADPMQGLLRYAWKTLLQNHPHDSICGCSIDAVHDENMTRFARAQQAAEIVTRRGARAIADRLAPAPPGAIRAVAINTDAQGWSGVVEATIEVPIEAAPQDREVDPSQLEEPLAYFGPTGRVRSVTGARGHALEFQVLGEQEAIVHRMGRYVVPAAIRVRRVRLAIDVDHVPGLGYAALDVHIGTPAPSALPGPVPTSRVGCSARSIENEYVRVEVREDGAVDVFDKRSGATYRQAFAFEDVGDVGDEYNYAPPVSDVRVTSAKATNVRVSPVAGGPLYAALLVELALAVPAGATGDRASRAREVVELPIALEVAVRAGSAIVEGVVRLENRARDHRLRVQFPTGASRVVSHRADTAFGSVERRLDAPLPAGPLVEAPVASAPMQSFVDAGDAVIGAVVVADGLVEYEVGTSGTNGATIGVTLVRAVGDLSRDDLSTRRGHAGPGLPTPGAQCLGRHEFRVGFMPRSAPPSASTLFTAARAFLAAPRVFEPCGGSGRLAPSGSFLQVTEKPGRDLVLSACKVADAGGAVVLRGFNVGDDAATLAIAAASPVTSAHHADLAEQRGAACVVTDDGVQLRVGPNRIETVVLDFAENKIGTYFSKRGRSAILGPKTEPEP